MSDKYTVLILKYRDKTMEVLKKVHGNDDTLRKREDRTRKTTTKENERSSTVGVYEHWL